MPTIARTASATRSLRVTALCYQMVAGPRPPDPRADRAANPANGAGAALTLSAASQYSERPMPARPRGSRIGVDIGGTFTDLVWIDDATGAVRVGKVLTTPKDPAQAVEHGVSRLLAEASAAPGQVRTLIHGTTLATHALIERKGARTGLLATEGFRDAVEIGREGRYDMYDLLIDPPAPLVPRHLRLEVPERILADGSVRRPLDVDAARRAIARLIESGV